jgi:hypothetical protein
VTGVLPGVRVDATEERPTDASGDAVINADRIFNDDLASGVGRHQSDSGKQRGALKVETMFAMTAMDRSINASAHVKHPTEDDRPRGTRLSLAASRGAWVSESLKALVGFKHGALVGA